MTPVPKEFQTIFRELVIATQPRSPMTPETCRVYYDTLAAFPIEVLRESAAAIRRASTFFPAAREWATAARACALRPAAGCGTCGGKGLIRIHYRTGEPFDLAICDCPAARNYRRGGEAFVRLVRGVTAEHRIALLEDFADEAVA